MPELPEIEVLKRSLEGPLVGRRIERVRVGNPNLREVIDPAALAKRLEGRGIEGLRRRAKYLLADLEGGETLIVHLGMSGRLGLVAAASDQEPHEHVSIFLDGLSRLSFRDPRRFGLVASIPTEELASDRRFRALGIEPLSDEFGGETLRTLAKRRRGPVKTFLMNGRVLVGVGNIYATEALHEAGIHPTRSVGRISSRRWSLLAESVQGVLRSAIDQGGTTLNDFRDGAGQEGYFQVSLSAYGREGERCLRCGGSIRRIAMAGRSTFYCPGCQR